MTLRKGVYHREIKRSSKDVDVVSVILTQINKFFSKKGYFFKRSVQCEALNKKIVESFGCCVGHFDSN